MTTHPSNVLEDLHDNRALWRLRAQLNASTVAELTADLADALGMPPEVARRVIESELQLTHQPDDDERAQCSTRRDIPTVASAQPNATSASAIDDAPSAD